MRRILPLLVVALCCTSCYLAKNGAFYYDKKIAELSTGVLEDGEGAEAPAPKAWVLKIEAKKKAEGDAFAFLRANRRLYPPFQVLTVAGLMPGEDPSGFTGNAQVCVELDERASITDDVNDLKWVLICARREGDGFRVRAQNQLAQLGDVLFEGTDAVVLSIRHDEDDLIFEAGPATVPAPGGSGNGGLTLVASIPGYTPSSATDALTPSLGASFLTHPATVVFDAERIAVNGTPPVPLSDAAIQAFELGEQLDILAEVIHALNGAAPDTALATSLLDPVAGAVEAVRDAVLLLPVEPATKKAKTKLNAALEKLAKAESQLEKEKPAKTIMKTVIKAADGLLLAIKELDPIGP